VRRVATRSGAAESIRSSILSKSAGRCDSRMAVQVVAAASARAALFPNFLVEIASICSGRECSPWNGRRDEIGRMRLNGMATD